MSNDFTKLNELKAHIVRLQQEKDLNFRYIILIAEPAVVDDVNTLEGTAYVNGSGNDYVLMSDMLVDALTNKDISEADDETRMRATMAMSDRVVGNMMLNFNTEEE